MWSKQKVNQTWFPRKLRKLWKFKQFTGGESFLNIKKESHDPYYNYAYLHGFEVEYRVSFNGNPTPKVGWIDNRGGELQFSESPAAYIKFEATKTNKSSTLLIRDLNVNDAGTYVFYADNGHERKLLTFRLLVNGKVTWNFIGWLLWFWRLSFCVGPPILKLSKSLVKPDAKGVNIDCIVLSYPTASTQCFFTPCENATSSDNEIELPMVCGHDILVDIHFMYFLFCALFIRNGWGNPKPSKSDITFSHQQELDGWNVWL